MAFFAEKGSSSIWGEKKRKKESSRIKEKEESGFSGKLSDV